MVEAMRSAASSGRCQVDAEIIELTPNALTAQYLAHLNEPQPQALVGASSRL
jgi:hypothetical protein